MRRFLKIYFLATIVCFSAATSAQQVPLIKLDALKARIAAGGDTVYIINLWATWCAPCVEELPAFEKLNAEATLQPFKVLLLSVDFPADLHTAVIPFVRRKTLKAEVLLLNEQDAQEYINKVDTAWSGAIPATLFLYKGRRRFIEKQLAYNDLLSTYQSIKNKQP